MILLLLLFLKFPGYQARHIEDDERINWALAHNYLESRTYSLRGTDVLDSLPATVYDKPLFHHPPMMTFLLIPFAWMDAPQAAIMVAWLGHAAAVIGIALVCWALRDVRWGGSNFLLWLPVLAMAVDPVLSFTARKLWLDNLVGGFCALSVGMACMAVSRQSGGFAVSAGVFGAFAALSKLTGLLALPVALAVFWAMPGQTNNRRIAATAGFFAPFGLLLAPWFFMFYREYGMLIPDWIKPDAALRAMSPHVDRAMNRGVAYYMIQTVFLAPVVLIVGGAMAGTWRRFCANGGWAWIGWLVIGYGGLIFLQQAGQGAQLRFLTPLTPAIYASMAAVLSATSEPRRSVLGAGLLMATAYSISATGFVLMDFEARLDDLVSMPEILLKTWFGE